jgi:hypothetical protein
MRFTVLADNFVSRSIAFKNREDVTAPVEQARGGRRLGLLVPCMFQRKSYVPMPLY